jgi:hypothetical protein
LKPFPFKEPSFSAAFEAVSFQEAEFFRGL